MPPIVTFTSDFEEREPFVASTKGVLYARCPGVQVVDLSHQIPRQSVAEGALFLAGAVPYFPDGTIHLVAVASGPRPLAVAVGEQIVICPDNGVITLVAERLGLGEVRQITHAEATPPEEGQTYFSRDVFAPAAGLLAAGASLEDLGERVEDLTLLRMPPPVWERNDVVTGEVMHVNRFGTLVTNIHRSFLEGNHVTKIYVGDFPLNGLAQSYANVPTGSPLALFGNEGYLEIAYNGDRADTRLNRGIGVVVTVNVQPAT